MKWVILSACAYEVAAIGSRGKVPTISEICARRRILAPVVLGCLAVHLYRYVPPERLAPKVMGGRLALPGEVGRRGQRLTR